MNDIETAEMGMIGALIATPQKTFAITDMAGLKAEHFSGLNAKKVFETLCDMRLQNIGIDVITLPNQLPEKLRNGQSPKAYIELCLDNVPDKQNIMSYATIVKDRHIKRQIEYIYEDASKNLKNGEQGVNILSELRFNLNELSQDSGVMLSDNAHAIQTARELHKQAQTTGCVGIPSRWPEIHVIVMGYKPGKVSVLAARPGCGKTTMACNEIIHKALKLNMPVSVFSLEMDTEEILSKMICETAGLNSTKFDLGQASEREQKRWDKAAKKIEKAPIYIDDRPKTIDQLCNGILDHKVSHGSEFVVIDYLQYIQSSSDASKRSMTRNNEVASWTGKLGAAVKNTNVSALLLSQLSRPSGYKNEPIPQLHNLRDSGAIEQDAFMVAFIYENPDVSVDTERKIPVIWDCQKNRRGPTGQCQMIFNKPMQRFEIPTGDNE